MAALDVVYRRLTQVGLSELCLQLHSSKAQKMEVLDQLRERAQKITIRTFSPIKLKIQTGKTF